MSLLCIETQKKIEANKPLRLLTRPENDQFCGVSHKVLTEARSSSGTVEWVDGINLCDGELVIHAGMGSVVNMHYTLRGIRIGKPVGIILKHAAQKFLPNASRFFAPEPGVEKVAFYSYSVADGEVWFGRYDTRDEALQVGLEEFPGDGGIRTRKEYHQYEDEIFHAKLNPINPGFIKPLSMAATKLVDTVNKVLGDFTPEAGIQEDLDALEKIRNDSSTRSKNG